MTIAAQLGVAPVLIARFGPIPLASVPANVLAVPAAGLVMSWGLTGGIVAGRRGRRHGGAPARAHPDPSRVADCRGPPLGGPAGGRAGPGRLGPRRHRVRDGGGRTSSGRTGMERARASIGRAGRGVRRGYPSRTRPPALGARPRRRAVAFGQHRRRRAGRRRLAIVVGCGGRPRGAAPRRGRDRRPAGRVGCQRAPAGGRGDCGQTSARCRDRAGGPRRLGPGPPRPRAPLGATTVAVGQLEVTLAPGTGRLVVEARPRARVERPRTACRFEGRGANEPVVGGVPRAGGRAGPRSAPVRRPPPCPGDGDPQPHAGLVLRPGHLLRLRLVPRQGRAARGRRGGLPRRRRREGRPRPRGRRGRGARPGHPRRSRPYGHGSTSRSRWTRGGRASCEKHSPQGRWWATTSAGSPTRTTSTVAAAAGASVVATHIRLGPRVPDPDPVYHERCRRRRGRVPAERAERAEAAGIPRERIMVDAGLDLGKSEPQSLELLRAHDRLAALGWPLFLSASNKRFLGDLVGTEVGDRREASHACPRARHRPRQPDPPGPRRAGRPPHRRRDGRGPGRPRATSTA